MASDPTGRSRWPADDGANLELRNHHALLIGISEHDLQHRVDRACGGRLKRAASDARELEQVLLEVGYARSHVKCLCNHQATREAIRSALLEMRHIEPAGLVLIFWAGHGVQADSGTRLLPYNADPHQLDTTTLSVNEIATLVNVIDATSVAVVIDTCYAQPRPDSFLHPDWNSNPRLLTGRVVLFAGASTYLALETSGQGGILKSCLQDALTDAEGSLSDSRGFVRLEAVAGYLQRHVEERAGRAWQAAYPDSAPTGSPQKPFFFVRPGRLPPAGCNLGVYIRRRLAQEALPRPMVDLATRIVYKRLSPEEAAARRTTRSRLRPLLVELAHGRRDAASYISAHREVVLRELSTWQDDDLLRPFVTRLPYYCLECEDSDQESSPQRRVAELTLDFLVGERDREEYVRRLRLEFAVLDQLNSAPWSYGIRSRKGRNEQRFTTLIEAGTPIDPGRDFSRVLRTATDHQEWVRVELLTGRPLECDARTCELILVRRLQLPASLPKGHPVLLFLQRVGEKGLRLSLEVPDLEDPRPDGDRREVVPEKVGWVLEDSCGFHQLAALVSGIPVLPSEGSGPIGLRLVVEVCMGILNEHWQDLGERDAERVTHWVMQTTRALEQRDGVALKSVLTQLLEGLQQARNISTVSILETLVVATQPAAEIMDEFRRRARALFRFEKVKQGQLAELWELVDVERGSHKVEPESPSLAEMKEEIHVLYDLLAALKRMMDRWGSVVSIRDVEGAHIDLVRLRGIVADVLAFAGLSETHRATLEALESSLVKISIGDGKLEYAIDDYDGSGLYELFTDVTAFAVEALLESAPTPSVNEGRLRELTVSLRLPSIAEEEALRHQLVDFVEDWHERWQEESGFDTEVLQQVTVVQDLLFALEKPERTDEAITRILRQEPLETGVLTRLASDLRDSDWLHAAPESTRDFVGERLETFEGMLHQWRRVASFQVDTLRTYLSPYVDRLPAEALAVIEALNTESKHPRSPPLIRGRTDDELMALDSPEAVELLEEMPQAVPPTQEGNGLPSPRGGRGRDESNQAS